jgi:DUF1009 family protein
MPASLGIVAGAGGLPALVARRAHATGWRVVVFCLDAGSASSAESSDALRDLADVVVPCGVGNVGLILATLQREGIRRLVLAGKVGKDVLFSGASLDGDTAGLLARARDWTDRGLLEVAADALAGIGVELGDQREFLGDWLAPRGQIAGPSLSAGGWRDVQQGLEVARRVASAGIGQTVVLREGCVAAVEAMEGTDAAVRRGLSLAGAGAIVVKATAPEHDYRFDVPTVGPETLVLCVEGRAAALAVEAGRVALIDRDGLCRAAEQAGIGVVGVTADLRDP